MWYQRNARQFTLYSVRNSLFIHFFGKAHYRALPGKTKNDKKYPKNNKLAKRTAVRRTTKKTPLVIGLRSIKYNFKNKS